MTKLIAIIKYDCRFNFVHLSIYEYLCIMFEFMFISHSFLVFAIAAILL